MKFKVTTAECAASAHPDGAFSLTIIGIPNTVMLRLRDAKVDSIELRPLSTLSTEELSCFKAGEFRVIVENSRLVGELVERLKAQQEIPLGLGNQEMSEDELFHILCLLNIYWD
jgi:hypothetical protein